MNTIKKKKGEKGRPDLITALTLLVTFFLKKNNNIYLRIVLETS